MVWEVLDCEGYAVQYINVQIFSNLGGDFEDSLFKLSPKIVFFWVFWFQMFSTNNTLCSRGPETAVLP